MLLFGGVFCWLVAPFVCCARCSGLLFFGFFGLCVLFIEWFFCVAWIFLVGCLPWGSGRGFVLFFFVMLCLKGDFVVLCSC